jgi:hypothetical protein
VQDCPPAPDVDSDGATDAWDNCPSLSNPAQTDTDGDSLGNVCDPDDDNDGLHDTPETNTGTYLSPTDTGSDPLVADSDGDGYDDGQEVTWGSDPNDPTSNFAALPALSSIGMALLACVLIAFACLRTLRRHRVGTS